MSRQRAFGALCAANKRPSTSPTGQCGRPQHRQSGPSSAPRTASPRERAQPMNDRTARTSTFAPAPQAAKNATHVLVVDDDADIRETLRVALEDVGYTVHEAPDGLIAMGLQSPRSTPHGRRRLEAAGHVCRALRCGPFG